MIVRFYLHVFMISAVVFWAAMAAAAPAPVTTPVDGLRQNTPSVHALTNVRIVTSPGEVIEKGTIVVRDGVIEAVGPEIKPPADARVWDLSGKTAYAGFIDAYSELVIPAEVRVQGASHWNAQIAPQLDASEHYVADAATNEKLRSQGIAVRLVAPGSRTIKGQSVLVSLSSLQNSRAILKPMVAQHIRLTISFGSSFGSGSSGYPNSPMGAVALARQAMLDADWYARVWAAWKTNGQLSRPERNDALEALGKTLTGNQPVIIDSSNEQFFLRADRFAREFGLSAIIRGSGREYRRLDDIKATGRAVIVPLNFSQAPNVGTLEESLDVSLEQLMHWDHAPENPARLDNAGVPIMFTTQGLLDPGAFLSSVRKAVDRGLKPDSALAALTLTPARLLGMTDRLGTIGPGKIANLVVTDGDLFARRTNVIETWVDGQRFEIERQPTVDPRGTWDLELTAADDRILKLKLKLTGSPRQMSGELEKSGEDPGAKIRLSQAAVRQSQLSFRLDGKSLGHEGPARASGTVEADQEGKLTLVGTLVWADGASEKLTGKRTAELPPSERRGSDRGRGRPSDERPAADKPAEEKPPGEQPKTDAPEGAEEKPEAKAEAEKADADKPAKPASFPVNYPLGDFGRAQPPEQPALVAFKNVTLWTCGPDGIIEGGTLVIGNGKIIAAGKDVEVPADAKVIDAAGKHISPGIIDCHSHMATDGGVNESAQAITAEVRIGDFIDANDITIYRQLAGGVTAANILHGSANPIGGQNQVIKLRWGLGPEQLKMTEAPQGIKFALGENVKQSNRSERSARYPQSRMGVEQIIGDAFAAARDYQKAWDLWNQNHEGLPPRRDLELEALSEILAQKRWIHCHSYRQDEILALLRVCEQHNVKVGSLQHILEGYKVADAIARHGATSSSFSDWWAYKYEVIDAIPYNGAMMHKLGIVVSFNSDDAELARHLNHEAAKALKYGGVEPVEAMKFVTLNPAKQLRIDQYVGSLEAGKHADFVVWNTSPLSVMSCCEQTWVDGRKYFDREEDRALRAEQSKMRTALVRKVLESGQSLQRPEDERPEEAELWPRYDEFCRARAR